MMHTTWTQVWILIRRHLLTLSFYILLTECCTLTTKIGLTHILSNYQRDPETAVQPDTDLILTFFICLSSTNVLISLNVCGLLFFY